MKKYILIRFLKSIISIFIVVSITVIIVFKMVPVYKVFQGDQSYQKMKGNNKTVFMYKKLEELGYLEYLDTNEMCKLKSDDPSCKDIKSDEYKRVVDEFEKDGYTVQLLEFYDQLQGNYIAYRYYGVFELLANFYGRLFQFDGPNKVQDIENPDLERGYKIAKDFNGVPSLQCSGCRYKYQVYFDLKFPFIHQNILKFNFGESYPQHTGVHTLDVIGNGQGTLEPFEQNFPTGKTMNSPIFQHTVEYKYLIDHLDEQKFTDHYANGKNKHENLSMISTSYLFGLLSLILAYAIALPSAIAMSRNKDKLVDKIGIAYINVLIAIPSLAFIFLMNYLGSAFGLPDKFPHLGFGNIKSYIMPVVCLALIQTPSLMMWIRRYMVDQQSADYVKFAKAKGLSRKEISRNHILKNAIIPIVNSVPASIVLAISGSVITESVFSIPGMGKMLPDAIKAGNNNMVVTLTFIFTSLAIFSVFIGDLLMTKIDPRITLNEKKDKKDNKKKNKKVLKNDTSLERVEGGKA